MKEEEIDRAVAAAEVTLTEQQDQRGLRLWEWIRVPKEFWPSLQYGDGDGAWVVALMGRRCLYYNRYEAGWGWGEYDDYGQIATYHWEEFELAQAVWQTVLALKIDANR